MKFTLRRADTMPGYNFKEMTGGIFRNGKDPSSGDNKEPYQDRKLYKRTRKVRK